jgi:L-aspartate oxidase
MTSGGASTMFVHHMYPEDITGDGYAIARRAGATMANMEFLQAGVGLAYPKINLIGNQLWEMWPKLVNGQSEAFLEKYIEGDYTEEDVIRAKGTHFPFSVVDSSRFVEIGIQREMLAGNTTPNGNVYLDFTRVDFEHVFAGEKNHLRDMWPLTYERFKSYGIDVYTQKLEIACFAHCVNGGILIDENAESSIKGLFAAGETAAGPHGADRLGGNMSVTCQVFGRRAGLAAAARAKNAVKIYEDETLMKAQEEYLARSGDLRTDEIKELSDTFRKTVEENLLIIRNEQGLSKLLGVLSGVENRIKGGGATNISESLLRTLELANLLETARLMANAALTRKESRGSHYRSDYPDKDDTLSQQIII